VIWAAINLGMTRCIFLLGLPLGATYLIWRRKSYFILALPITAAMSIAFAPAVVRERIVSVVRPHSDIDSNSHRAICRIVGWEMVKAHPWLGLGPEQIGRQFDHYIPPSVRRPLPPGWYGHLHNIYLQYAAERGVFGLLSIMWLIASAASEFSSVLRRKSLTPEMRAILHGAVAVILGVLAEGAFEYNLGDSEVLTIFLSVIACGYVVAREAAELETSAEECGVKGAEAELCGSESMTF
jgi:O-antigen ligase